MAFFITLEGIDGSGKSTQLERLVSLIKDGTNGIFGDKYTPIWLTREPTKMTEAGRKICDLLKGQEKLTGEVSSSLFVKDRHEHSIKYISPRLSEGNIVICDRYDLSTYSYQMVQGIDFDFLYDFHGYKEEKTLIPDITIVFDVSVEIALERIRERGALEQFEVESFQRKLAQKQNEAINRLLERQPSRKILRINSEQSIEKVTEELFNKLREIQ